MYASRPQCSSDNSAIQTTSSLLLFVLALVRGKWPRVSSRAINWKISPVGERPRSSFRRQMIWGMVRDDHWAVGHGWSDGLNVVREADSRRKMHHPGHSRLPLQRPWKGRSSQVEQSQEQGAFLTLRRKPRFPPDRRGCRRLRVSYVRVCESPHPPKLCATHTPIGRWPNCRGDCHLSKLRRRKPAVRLRNRSGHVAPSIR